MRIVKREKKIGQRRSGFTVRSVILLNTMTFFLCFLLVFVQVHTTGEIFLFSFEYDFKKAKREYSKYKAVLENQVEDTFRVESWVWFAT